MFNEQHCKIDWQALNSSWTFVANQSMKLRLISETDNAAETDADMNKLTKLQSGECSGEKLAACYADTQKFRVTHSNPHLWISVDPIDVKFGCVAQVRARVVAAFDDTKMIATGKEMSAPQIELWSQRMWVRAPYDTIGTEVIHAGEQLLKDFVNAWTAAQSAHE